MKVSPLRLYRCADCSIPVVREKGGVRFVHAVAGVDHAPHVVLR